MEGIVKENLQNAATRGGRDGWARVACGREPGGGRGGGPSERWIADSGARNDPGEPLGFKRPLQA